MMIVTFTYRPEMMGLSSEEFVGVESIELKSTNMGLLYELYLETGEYVTVRKCCVVSVAID